jgi:DNA processing protein
MQPKSLIARHWTQADCGPRLRASQIPPFVGISSMAPVSTSESRLHAVLQLALTPGVGPRTYKALVEYFGSPESVVSAAPSELRRVPGVGPKLMQQIVAARHALNVDSELNDFRALGLSLLTEDDESYPRLLREIYDPPTLLFIRGELAAADSLAIAIVGTRHATTYGVRQAERLAAGLARAGFTIISGLARGIDAAAHRGALATGGRTIAILGCGLLNIYPPEHADLATQIQARGVLLSEAPPRSQPHSGMFPQRNRIITGMSLGVVVVEAAQRSGAMISAGHAMEQGREVFAMPGPVDSRTSRGCHQLIREGAKLVETVDDVLQELGPLVEAAPQEDGRVIRHPAELQLNPQEQAVLSAVDTELSSIDQIVVRSGIPVHRVLSTLAVLEMRRLVKRHSGQLVARL